MKTFHSFSAFAVHLIQREAATLVALHEGLRVVAQAIEKTAKAELGTYQPEVGKFPAWEPLAESTIDERIAQGYSPDEPLLRSGDLRDSIKHEVEGLEAIIGSASPIALYQELGTEHIPPRPFLGPAAIHNEKKMVRLLGAVAVAGLADGKPIDVLGYNFEATEGGE